MFGTDKGIAIKIGLQGDLTADLFVTGSIGYDSATQTIALEDFVFDLNSESSLVGAADWLAHDVIIERISPYLSLPVGNIFAMMPNILANVRGLMTLPCAYSIVQ